MKTVFLLLFLVMVCWERMLISGDGAEVGEAPSGEGFFFFFPSRFQTGNWKDPVVFFPLSFPQS